MLVTLVIAFFSADVGRLISVESKSISVESQPAAQESTAALARRELLEGKAQLQQYKLYAALPLLQDALKLYTQAGDQNGIGAASDALGDLYEREGQYATARNYFQRARDAFNARKEVVNTNLELGKLAETYLLTGDFSTARTLLASFDKKRGPGDRNAGGSGTDGGPLGVDASFFSTLAGAANLGCSGRPDFPEPPFMGHGVLGPNRVARMDLRVRDQNGDPVQNANVGVVSERPPGLPPDFICDCQGQTDPNGQYLAPPIHVGGQVTLTVNAKGYAPFQTTLPEKSLSQPVHVTLILPGGGGGRRRNTSPSEIDCFDYYRFFIGYAKIKLIEGRAAFQTGQLGEAEAAFNDLLSATKQPEFANFQAAQRFRAAAETSVADIAFRKGDLATARTKYTQAIDDATRDGRLDLVWAADAGLGKTLWSMAHQERGVARSSRVLFNHVAGQSSNSKLQSDSLNAYRDAVKNIETIFAGSIRADESRTTFLANTHQVFVDAASAMSEASLAGDRSLTAEALTINERSRSRSLLDLLSETGADITQGVSPELLKRKEQNLARQQEIAQQLSGIALAGESRKQSVASLETELQSLTTEFDNLENQIRSTSPRYASLVHNQPLTLPQIQQQVLDDRTALLEYCLGEQNSYLWVVQRSGVQLFRLAPRSRIEELASEFRGQLIPPKLQRRIAGIDIVDDEQRGLGIVGPSENVPAYVAASNALYRAVLEPAASSISDKRLLVVADGALNYIPFEALVKSSAGADYTSLDYLVKTNEVVYTPSASVIGALQQQSGRNPAREGAGRNILLVADPVFNLSDPRLKGTAPSSEAIRGLGLESAVKDITGQQSSGVQLARLSGTRTEAEEIAKIARTGGNQTDTWLDLRASEDDLRSRDISNYRIVHVATHGLLDAERPQFTGVVLSLVGNQTNDGFLRTDEIFNLKLGSPLVMLSACDTGLGKEKRGEGVMGLTRAFMYAGAPTVGVSLWSVADKSTAELMTDFYRRLLASSPQPPAAALRDAQLAMIAGRKYSAPFYWAPFILVGEWR
ncbi:MAG TPA: CHAT domain-containing protein [Pyrinomonadaceae bacterium]|nr:CHAT domain-containing protein [Pyrinomonadaceae bacterium]